MSENFETLIQHLNDDDDNVRSRAAVDLGKSGDPRAIEPLLSTLLNDNNRYVREYAAEALDKLHWQPPGGEISAAYFVAKRKFNSCVEIGPPAVNALIRELNAEAGFRRKEAIRALGKIGGLAATEAIKQLITDGSVGEFAQDTLKKMVNTETKDIVEKMLENDASGVQGSPPLSELEDVLPTWLELGYDSFIYLMDALKHLNQAIETQNNVTIGRVSRDALVIFEYVIARREGGQPDKDAHFHKAVIYVRHADQCDPIFEADTQMQFLQAARNCINKATSVPQLIHPRFLNLQKNIEQRIQSWPYSIG